LSAEELRAKAAVSKLEDGNIRAAVRIICSSDEPAADSVATLNALIAKHPDAPADIGFPNISLDGPFEPLQVSEDDVRRAVISFPPGSSGSLDSLSPQHLKDMIGLDGSPELLPSLTSLVNLLPSGSLPGGIAKVIFGENLIALNKKRWWH